MEIKTIANDEKYLRQISQLVNFNDKKLASEINALAEYCINNEVLAMASVQLGIPKRIIYVKNTDVNNLLDNTINEARVLINPVIISRKGKTKYWETCASCLDNMGLVTRPYEIIIEYKDAKGDSHTDVFEGFESTVLSHEFDHLNGILHTDLSEQIINMPFEERVEFRKTHGYEIISKDCNFEEEIELRTQSKIKNYSK